MKSLSFTVIFILLHFTASLTVDLLKITYKVEYKEFNKTIGIRTCVPDPFIVDKPDQSASLIPYNTPFQAFYVRNSQSSYLPLLQPLPLLTIFIFEDSKLTKITSDHLKLFPGLIELSFHKNLLSEITADTFVHNPMLRKVSLDANRITSIDSGVFKCLKHLREVYLNDNELSKLDEKLFMHNPQIITLNLEINRIAELPVSVFHELEMLSTLKLDYNELTQLPDRIFVKNPNLKNFTASSNQLKIIGLENNEIFEKMEVIDLMDNPCTVDLYRGHDFEELRSAIERNCKPECDELKVWRDNELNEVDVKFRIKREAGRVDFITKFEDLNSELVLMKSEFQNLVKNFEEIKKNSVKMAEFDDLNSKYKEIESNSVKKTEFDDLNSNYKELESNSVKKTEFDDLNSKYKELESNSVKKTEFDDLNSKYTELKNIVGTPNDT